MYGQNPKHAKNTHKMMKSHCFSQAHDHKLICSQFRAVSAKHPPIHRQEAICVEKGLFCPCHCNSLGLHTSPRSPQPSLANTINCFIRVDPAATFLCVLIGWRQIWCGIAPGCRLLPPPSYVLLLPTAAFTGACGEIWGLLHSDGHVTDQV